MSYPLHVTRQGQQISVNLEGLGIWGMTAEQARVVAKKLNDRADDAAFELETSVRKKRRDELAIDFAGCTFDYNDVDVTTQHAIDYIIDMEERMNNK